MGKDSVSRKNVKKRKKKKSIMRRILSLLLLVLIVGGAYFGYLLYSTIEAANNSYSELERGEKSKLRAQSVEVSKDPFSILLLGIEDYASEGKQGRTDSIIVATFNPTDSTMKLLSIPRDTRVYIDSKGREDKINHAYGSGGKDSTIEAVEDFLEIPIDHYATVDFDGFKDIVDELGGVTVDVPFDFWEKSDETNERLYFTEGEMHLSGEEALAYARMRKRDPRGDFGRNDRQKQIIEASIDQAMSPATLLKIDTIVDHIGENVETNLRLTQALAIQKKFPNFNSSNIESLSLEGSDDYINGIYYFEPSEESLSEVKEELKTHLGEENITTETSEN
ncbi:LytR family transcriptional regulator [Metabacillus halosaccharovorans]|nr:LytR family transcriptional regulator [Metabacillus halosaccharovorans]